MNEDVIRECIRELDTIKKRLTAILSNQKVDIFQKPGKLDVWEYWKEKGYRPEEAGKFYDYYTSNGWRVGKNGMKCWKTAANQWNRRVEDRERDKRNSKSDRHDKATEEYLYGK